ncbi:MAG: cyclic nucleotide-binding domain-containing protein [Treponema sp.]|nr:cyclic nucleotide-binding domain-containing protein [Treponema sp.]
MPKPLQYSNGSLIYYKGEEAEKIYILQSGKVSLVYTDIETGNDVRHPVEPGEFFGVKSALGHFPREENAIVLSDSTVMSFTVPEFEAMAMLNTRIILKMLKVFSNQMRRTHAQVASLLEVKEVAPDKGLFAIGEKYLKSKRFDHAKYIFSRYITLYPTGEFAKQAAEKLRFAEAGIPGPGKAKKPATRAPVQPPSATAAASGDHNAAKDYYDAVTLISQRKYNDAMKAFLKIITENKDPEWTEKSAYEIGNCLFIQNKYESCIKHCKKFLSLYPKYPDVRDVMFFIGQSYEKLENNDQAMGWYKKIITTSGAEKDGTRTKAMKALNEMGEK